MPEIPPALGYPWALGVARNPKIKVDHFFPGLSSFPTPLCLCPPPLLCPALLASQQHLLSLGRDRDAAPWWDVGPQWDVSSPSHTLRCCPTAMGRDGGAAWGAWGHPFTEVPDTLFTRSLKSISGWRIIPRSGSFASSVLGTHATFFGSALGFILLRTWLASPFRC